MFDTVADAVGPSQEASNGQNDPRARIESYDSKVTMKTGNTNVTPEKQSDSEQETGLVNGSGAINAGEDRFGDESHAAVKYKTMKWWHVGLLMLAETVSLGVLSLSWAMSELGLVPTLILIAALGAIATYTGLVYGQFKLKHKHVCDMQDAGRIIGGKPLGLILVFGQILVLVFIMAAHLNVFTTMMNVLTKHSTCSIVFSIVGLLLSFLLGLPRKLQHMSYLSAASCISIALAVIITMVGVSIKKPDAGHVAATREQGLTSSMIAVLQIILAFSGHAAYFGFQAELKDQKDFRKAVFLMQSCSITFYMTTAIVIYYYTGVKTPSPALKALGTVVAKVAWGIAIPTIVIAGIVNGHVACKAIYVRMHEGTAVIHEKSFRSYASWTAICATLWVVAWVIAEAIPSFPQLLALVSALFSGWFSFGISGVFWLSMNWETLWSTRKQIFLTCVNVGIITLGTITCVLGLFASGNELASGRGGRPFSCADTSFA